jgi:hypothetical protein
MESFHPSPFPFGRTGRSFQHLFKQGGLFPGYRQKKAAKF